MNATPQILRPTAASEQTIRVLIADDEDNQRKGLASMVNGWGFSAQAVGDGEAALKAIPEFAPHIIITDLMMPRMDGYELLRRLSAEGAGIPAIVLTAFGNIETALNTMLDLGAFWFLEKPIQPRVLRMLLDRAAAQARLAGETERLQRQLAYRGVLDDLAGISEPMQQVFSLIRQVAPSKANVFITGESGTGKELVSRAIHRLSPRADGPFIAINCAALPETLMESELFGHEKGSFTGAVERRAGCFELAQGGTLLLDELAEMPIALQAKLLRVLEDSKVRRLGGKTEMTVDVRVIAATNRPPEEAIKKSQLREDLYYRLNVFELKLPPLRQRLDDLPVLIDAILGDMNEKHGLQVTGVDAEALKRMANHAWPGNVRELRNALERAAIVTGKGSIRAEALPASIGPANVQTPASAQVASDSDSVNLPVGTTVEQAEKALILLTLNHTRNNKTRAAEMLGISLKTLFNKLKEYGSDKEATAEGAV
jgi:DNA-binding NtrC family response regulator